jgi:hypothetical protein
LRNWIQAHRRVCSALAMSLRGMAYDDERIEYHHGKLKEDADAKLAELRYLVADPDFNPNSPPQKIRLIYKVLGARPRNAKGRYVKRIEDASSGAVALRAMRTEHPILRRVVNGIMSASEPAKQISNVIGIKKAPWHRLYTAYNGVGTTTSRFSSSESPLTYGTNLQNVRDKYRDWIVADPDSVLLDIDLSAGDDVFVTFESGDPRKIELFRSGRDAHAVNAVLFFPNWTYEEIIAGKRANDPRIVHPITGIRQITKKLAHGCNYLMMAMTLLMTAGRDAIVAAAKEWGHTDAHLWNQERLVGFCEFLETRYREHYTRFARSGTGSWYSELAEQLRESGTFTTPFLYSQRFLGSPSDQGVIRAVAATAGQAGTAGRINMALDEFDYGIIPRSFRDAPNPEYSEHGLRISREEHGATVRLQTHDSFTFNINYKHPNHLEGVRRIFEVMNRQVIIRNSQTGMLETFRLRTEANLGKAWGKNMLEIKQNTVEGFTAAMQELQLA